MGRSSAVAQILAGIPAGLVRRASDPIESLPSLKTGLTDLDRALGGGWARGRLNVLGAGASASTGRTTVACATVAAVTGGGFQAAWIDGDGSLDTGSLAAWGADMDRLLWVAGPLPADRTMRAASEIIQSGLFELVVLRPSADGWPGGSGLQWTRLSREAGLSRTTVLVLARNACTNAAGATEVMFDPACAEWVGPFGQAGYLDGASICVRRGFDDDRPAIVRARVVYGGIQ